MLVLKDRLFPVSRVRLKVGSHIDVYHCQHCFSRFCFKR